MNERFPTVGIIGAGQLARMTVAPAEALGINLLLFAQNSEDSAAQIAPHVVGDFRDLTALQAFAKKCDVITFEHELVPLSVIKGLEATGVKVTPSSQAFQYSQDKAAMRERLTNYLAPKWQIVTKAEEILEKMSAARKGKYIGKENSRFRVIENIKLLSPDGIIYTKIEGIKEFAEEHNLSKHHLCELLAGKRRSHHGWALVNDNNQ